MQRSLKETNRKLILKLHHGLFLLIEGEIGQGVFVRMVPVCRAYVYIAKT